MAADETPAEDAEAAEPDTSGWYRNTDVVELTVLPNGYPSATLAPGAATWLPHDPHHPHLEPCDEPEPEAVAAADPETES